jgi:hypothetical protein
MTWIIIIGAFSAAIAAASSLDNGRTLRWIRAERIKAAGLWDALSRAEKKMRKEDCEKKDWFQAPDL